VAFRIWRAVPWWHSAVIMAVLRLSLPPVVAARCYGRSHDLSADRGSGKSWPNFVAEARRSHRPVTISEHGRRLRRWSTSMTSPTLRIARRSQRAWRTRPPSGTGPALRNWMPRSTGSTRNASR